MQEARRIRRTALGSSKQAIHVCSDSLSPCASAVSDEIAASVWLAQSYTLRHLCHIV